MKEFKDLPIAEKKWGCEYLICREPHAAKIMILEPKTQVSLHWHANKSETFILIEGRMTVETISRAGETVVHNLIRKYDSITLQPNTPHTFYCPEGELAPAIFIEASTEDKDDDSYRIFPSRGEKDFDNRGPDSR